MTTAAPATTPVDLVHDLDRLVALHTDWREHGTVNLNAATNSLSPAARAALSTVLADKGISSGLRSRHHQGGEYIDAIEDAIERQTVRLFHAGAADLRPPSGSIANALAVASLLPSGRAILVGDENALGHLSLREEGWSGRMSRRVESVPYGENGVDVDLDALERTVDAVEPGMIVVGTQTMMFPVPLTDIRRIADRVGALVVYDAAHPLGLIAGGCFQDPLGEGADVVTASTQKTMPGPVGGVILTRDAATMRPVYEASNRLLSNYQNNRVLALGYTVAEMAEFGREYAQACVANARFLAAELAARGLEPLFAERGFTVSNLFLLPWPGKDAADAFASRCEQAQLIVSTTRLPGAPGSAPRWGSRIGVQDLTRRGYGAGELTELAGLIARIAAGAETDSVSARMTELARAFDTTYYCFENGLPPRPSGV